MVDFENVKDPSLSSPSEKASSTSKRSPGSARCFDLELGANSELDSSIEV